MAIMTPRRRPHGARHEHVVVAHVDHVVTFARSGRSGCFHFLELCLVDLEVLPRESFITPDLGLFSDDRFLLQAITKQMA